MRMTRWPRPANPELGTTPVISSELWMSMIAHQLPTACLTTKPRMVLKSSSAQVEGSGRATGQQRRTSRHRQTHHAPDLPELHTQPAGPAELQPHAVPGPARCCKEGQRQRWRCRQQAEGGDPCGGSRYPAERAVGGRRRPGQRKAGIALHAGISSSLGSGLAVFLAPGPRIHEGVDHPRRCAALLHPIPPSVATLHAHEQHLGLLLL